VPDAQSAPELPHEVAKEYGLHHEIIKPAAKSIPKSETSHLPQTEVAQRSESDPNAEADALLDNPDTEKAVDDIVAKESDELLGVQDGKTGPPNAVVGQGFGHRLKHFLHSWWRNKWARWLTILALVAIIAAVASVPRTRYAVLNTFGVRSSASVTVLDVTKQLPLKNVTVSMGDQHMQTDVHGTAIFHHLKLGNYQLTIKRIAFASLSRQLIIGWGSNPLGSVTLQPVGTQYVIQVNDYLSGKPISGAEADSDQGNALADQNGRITLTVDDTNVTTLAVQIQAKGYRTENVTLSAATAQSSVQPLVPAQKDVFVSKDSGHYDVYSMDLDGKNKKLVLAGTGNETDNISLLVSPDGSLAALVSTRDTVRDGDGFLLSTLTVMNLAQGTSMPVDHAEQIQLIDWLDGRLIYRSTIAGASAANAQRNRLIAYTFSSNLRQQLASANQFNMALTAQGKVYYAASSTDPGATLGLFRIKSDGTGREQLSNQEVWTGLRSSYNVLSLQTPDSWYTYDIAAGQLGKSSAPGNLLNYAFVPSPDGTRAAWVDIRDGKGVLLLDAIATGQNMSLTTQTGLVSPAHWAGNKAIIYRVSTPNESGEYVISPDGGAPHKLADVTPTH